MPERMASTQCQAGAGVRVRSTHRLVTRSSTARRARRQLGDMLLEASANASFRVILREEEGPSDDFAIALDDVSSVTAKSGSELVINVNLAYVGDVWIKKMGFGANLLLHRPSLDRVTSEARRFSLEDFFRDSTSLELHFPKVGG
jgi:hypothetical protein